MNPMFQPFACAFPADPPGRAAVKSSLLADQVQTEFGVTVPTELRQFWDDQGSGYFGERALYFFGDGSRDQPRESLISWNKLDFWPDIYPHPSEGGPVFFAETCFGDQLGFRWENGQCIFILFCVDTFEAFLITTDGSALFTTILADRMALMDPTHYHDARARFGLLPLGMHYAPFLSPMLGGTGDSENFCLETPTVHFRTAVATYKACQPV